MERHELPEIAFCEIDTSEVETEVIRRFEQITERTLYPGNPERLFLEALAYEVALGRFLIDYAGKMNLLHYACDDYLDHLGNYLGCFRLEASSALTTLEFSLDQALGYDLVIAQGVRVSCGDFIFETTAECSIPAGELSVQVQAVCQSAGAGGNGFLSGQINRLVDNVPYISKVENTTLSLGGTDEESDDRFRGRIQLAAEDFSSCGPQEAYRFWAMGVSSAIQDVAVWSPEPGAVHLAPLLSGGELPTAEIIAAVYEAVSDTSHRPLTDTINVVSPEAVEFQALGTYFVRTSYASKAGQIQALAARALTSFQTWQQAKLGRDIVPSELIARIQAIEGVQRVELSAPAYQALDSWQVAQCTGAALVYGGLSDE